MEKRKSSTFSRAHMVKVDLSNRFQQIDGFGVNINGTCWEDRLMPVMHLLIDELGARLFRLSPDTFSDWVDPAGEADASVLNEETYRRVYTSDGFKRSWDMARYLNQRGIQPYISVFGMVPRWMLAEDGKNLVDYESFAEMMASLVEWAKKEEKIDFELFGPLNETNTGPPQEPYVNPEEFVKVTEVLAAALQKRGLGDIKLVVPEAWGPYDFIPRLVKAEHLAKHIGVFGTHEYESSAPHPEFISVQDNVKTVRESASYAKTKFWLTEFGDMDQSGEKEWYSSWVAMRHLIQGFHSGIQGALVWDAFDNYQKRCWPWTIYGLIRAGTNRYTPKKRFYALKQVYRFVLPGFYRVGCSLVPEEDVEMVAFASEESNDFSLIVMNPTSDEIYVNILLEGVDENKGSVPQPVQVYRTTEELDCARVARIPLWTHNCPFNGMDVCLKPQSITTVTTIRD